MPVLCGALDCRGYDLDDVDWLTNALPSGTLGRYVCKILELAKFSGKQRCTFRSFEDLAPKFVLTCTATGNTNTLRNAMSFLRKIMTRKCIIHHAISAQNRVKPVSPKCYSAFDLHRLFRYLVEMEKLLKTDLKMVLYRPQVLWLIDSM